MVFCSATCLQFHTNNNQVLNSPIMNNEISTNLDVQDELRDLFHVDMGSAATNTLQDNMPVCGDC